jgi:hypothetical protein
MKCTTRKYNVLFGFYYVIEEAQMMTGKLIELPVFVFVVGKLNVPAVPILVPVACC